MLSKITNFLGGSLFGEIKDTVMSYLPPDLSPTQQADINLKLQELMHKKQMEANKALAESSEALNARIREQEGTAEDLKQFGWLGRIILFARGIQRPVWGFAVLAMDFRWFFAVGLTFSERQETALMVINILVLGFLFGERTIQNLTPLIIRVFGGKDDRNK